MVKWVASGSIACWNYSCTTGSMDGCPSRSIGRGIEAGGLFLHGITDRGRADNTPGVIVGRPFFNALTNAPHFEIVSVPGSVSGRVAMTQPHTNCAGLTFRSAAPFVATAGAGSIFSSATGSSPSTTDCTPSRTYCRPPLRSHLARESLWPTALPRPTGSADSYSDSRASTSSTTDTSRGVARSASATPPAA